jgi:2,4-diketo-3-deoxy-L-fuconate hydrolase
VLASQVHSTIKACNENLHEHVAGIVISNDVSARDVQIPQIQFFKGNSYRTFCPAGPVLCLLNPEDWQMFSSCMLRQVSPTGRGRQPGV